MLAKERRLNAGIRQTQMEYKDKRRALFDTWDVLLHIAPENRYVHTEESTMYVKYDSRALPENPDVNRVHAPINADEKNAHAVRGNIPSENSPCERFRLRRYTRKKVINCISPSIPSNKLESAAPQKQKRAF